MSPEPITQYGRPHCIIRKYIHIQPPLLTLSRAPFQQVSHCLVSIRASAGIRSFAFAQRARVEPPQGESKHRPVHGGISITFLPEGSRAGAADSRGRVRNPCGPLLTPSFVACGHTLFYCPRPCSSHTIAHKTHLPSQMVLF